MLALARAGPFGVSSRNTPPHVLSDTPSYLRARGVVSRLFSDDVDVSMWKAEVPDWGSNHTSWKPGVCRFCNAFVAPPLTSSHHLSPPLTDSTEEDFLQTHEGWLRYLPVSSTSQLFRYLASVVL